MTAEGMTAKERRYTLLISVPADAVVGHHNRPCICFSGPVVPLTIISPALVSQSR